MKDVLAIIGAVSVVYLLFHSMSIILDIIVFFGVVRSNRDRFTNVKFTKDDK